MMKWQIPAKTFLLGEYAALAGESAILITTKPCFELSLTSSTTPSTIHPDSPAGKYWQHTQHKYQLAWHDPYLGQGGLGASSAQFVGVFLADCYLTQTPATITGLLKAYDDCCRDSDGIRPSGYDVVAQSQHHLVVINRQRNQWDCVAWPFPKLAFLLVRTGQKVATHHHLQAITTQLPIADLARLVAQAQQAFSLQDGALLIETINAYQQVLSAYHLTAEHSLAQLQELALNPAILAAKGCGALGADVLLLIMKRDELALQTNDLQHKGWFILASNDDLFTNSQLIINNVHKTLEILSK